AISEVSACSPKSRAVNAPARASGAPRRGAVPNRRAGSGRRASGSNYRDSDFTLDQVELDTPTKPQEPPPGAPGQFAPALTLAMKCTGSAEPPGSWLGCTLRQTLVNTGPSHSVTSGQSAWVGLLGGDLRFTLRSHSGTAPKARI